MKIRPPDSSPGIPPEPEGVSEKKTGPEISSSSHTEQASSAAPARELFSSEALSSLRGVTNKSDLGNRFIGMALREFDGPVSRGDLSHIEKILTEHVGEDPFFQSKLDRISSLLAKSR